MEEERHHKNDSSDDEVQKILYEKSASSKSSSSAENFETKIPEHQIDFDNDHDSSDSDPDEHPPQTTETGRKSIQEKLLSLSQYGIEITVTNPQIISSSLRKHVMYTVAGNDSLGGFQVQRRYKEFLALRKILMIEWPGCCILSLPPKQAMVKNKQGNLDKDFIENRRKLLEYFLKNLSKNSYLLISEEFQLFLRGPNNFHKSNIVSKSANYIQIGQRYSKVFEKYWSYQRTPDVETEILNSVEFFEKGKVIVEQLDRACEVASSCLIALDKKSQEVVNHVQELSKNYQKREIYLNQRPSAEDIYSELKYWCRNNLLECKGISECVHRRAEIEKYKSSLLGKIQEEQKSIENRKAGKKKIIQYINKKSNEYYISQSETAIQQFEETISSIDTILNISAAIFLQEEVPTFKKKKINTLQIVIELFEEIGHKELSGFIERFMEINQKI